MYPKNRRPDEVSGQEQASIIGVAVILVLVVATLSVQYPITIVVAVVGLALLLASRSKTLANNRTVSTPEKIPSQMRKSVNPASSVAAKIHATADAAMRRAGWYAGTNHLRVDDIGLLVYEDDVRPKVYRLSEIPTNATHIRPFVVVKQPAAHSILGTGIIGFSLVDSKGDQRYSSRARYEIEPGQNFLTPPTWLPLADQNPDGKWSIVVSLGNDRLLAVHDFDWLRVGGEVRSQLSGDGEISVKMALLMSKPTIISNESVSLDDLLAEQEEEAPLILHSEL